MDQKSQIPKFEDEMGKVREYVDIIKKLRELPDHDCHRSPEDGCHVCDLWFRFKEEYGK
jgi:hypothetical protein